MNYSKLHIEGQGNSNKSQSKTKISKNYTTRNSIAQLSVFVKMAPKLGRCSTRNIKTTVSVNLYQLRLKLNSLFLFYKLAANHL